MYAKPRPKEPPSIPGRTNSGKNTRMMITVAKKIVADLGSGLEHGLEGRTAAPLRSCFPQPAKDVLDRDDRVVDERSDRDREAAQRHRVDRAAERGDGQDPGKSESGIAAEIAVVRIPEEQEEDDHDQDRPVPQGGGHVLDRDLDEIRLAEVLLLDHDTLGKALLQGGQRRRSHASRRGYWRHCRTLRMTAVFASVAVPRFARTDLDLTQISHRDREPAFGTHDGRSEIVDAAGASETPHQILLSLVHVESRRGVLGHLTQSIGEVIQAHGSLGESGGIELDLKLPHVSADGGHPRCRNGEKASPHRRLRHAAQLHGVDRRGT